MSNIETEKHKLLQIVLFGQPELDTKLAQPHLRQLLQRITFADRILPLSTAEIGAYVHYRLGVAGAVVAPIFSDAAIEELAVRSRGIPRLINVIAHKALMLAFGEGGARVERQQVALAAEDTEAVTPTDRRASWLRRLLSAGSP